MRETFGSTCHGAGRVMSRTAAVKAARGRRIGEELRERGVVARAAGYQALAEEMPEAYKDVKDVVEVVHRVDRNGRRVYDYLCDGARMERRTLLQLLCDESACPHAQATRQRWREFRGDPEPVPARRPPRSRSCPPGPSSASSPPSGCAASTWAMPTTSNSRC